jgi:hypothetical protein
VTPAALSVASGAALIPRNDDWVYRRIAVELADTGILSLHSVTTMMVGLIVSAQPLLRLVGDPSTAFAIAGLAFAIAGVTGAFALARQFLGPWRAALAASLVVVFPGYLAYATSFMTDAPTLAAQLICLALGARALRDRSVNLKVLALAVVVGFLGFSVREFAIVAPATVLASALWAQPRRTAIWSLAAALGLACTSLYAIKLSLPGQVVSGGVGSGIVFNMLPALTTISLIALPAAIVAARDRFQVWNRFDLAVGAELGLAIVGFHVIGWVHEGVVTTALLDNLTSQYGVPSSWYIIGGRPLVFADPVWFALNALALVATVFTSSVGTAVVGAYLRRSRRSGRSPLSTLGTPTGILAIFVLATLAGLAVYGSRYALFDRYFWPLLPPLALLLMYRARSEVVLAPAGASARPGVLVIASWLVLLSVSMLYMLNSFAFDAARWRGAERFVALGVPAENIDAGYEWVGQHQPDLPGPNPPPGNEIFYERWWPTRHACAIVAGMPDPSATTVDVIPWNLFLVGGPPEQLYLYRRASAGCGS